MACGDPRGRAARFPPRSVFLFSSLLCSVSLRVLVGARVSKLRIREADLPAFCRWGELLDPRKCSRGSRSRARRGPGCTWRCAPAWCAGGTFLQGASLRLPSCRLVPVVICRQVPLPCPACEETESHRSPPGALQSRGQSGDSGRHHLPQEALSSLQGVSFLAVSIHTWLSNFKLPSDEAETILGRGRGRGRGGWKGRASSVVHGRVRRRNSTARGTSEACGFVTEDIALGRGQDDAGKQRKGRPEPSKWRQVGEWGPEAKVVTEDVAKMFIAKKKKKKCISSQPAILSLIRLTFSACSVRAGNSARSWERDCFCLPSRNAASTWRNAVLSSNVF